MAAISKTFLALFAVLFATSGLAEKLNDNDKLHFVFELTRHGARAPTGSSEGYDVGEGMLTPQGMRQRYLLGAYNKKRYSEEYDLIDVEQGPEQVLMMSTIVNRTMQSGYSELMGMFQPDAKDVPKLTGAQLNALASEGVASPPFKVRKQQNINRDLGDLALPEGYVQLPIYDHNDVSMADDLDLNGCSYVNAVDGYEFPAESTYISVEFLKDDLREPFTNAFNLTKQEASNMSFMTLYGYCDVIQSNLFEGLGAGYDYTPQQLQWINQTVLSTLVLPLTDPVLSQNMYVSKMLRLPLAFMTRVTDGVIDNDLDSLPKSKFLSYSTHDWTVAKLLLFLDADNGLFDVIPFASSVMLELHSTEECASEECFWVETIYNGMHLEFEGDCADKIRCTYPEFMQMLQYKGFVNTNTQYEKECAKKWQYHADGQKDNFLYRQYSSAAYNIYQDRSYFE